VTEMVTSDGARGAPVTRRRWPRPTARTVFLSVVLAVLAVYTRMGFELEWRTAAGRIGAGFFPRIIGGLGLVLTAVALVDSVRGQATPSGPPVAADEEPDGPDEGRHPVPLVLTVLAAAAFVATLTTLGAVVASALFLLGMLWMLNRRHMVANVVLSIGLPVGLYLLFESLLNAGLPAGILPAF